MSQRRSISQKESPQPALERWERRTNIPAGFLIGLLSGGLIGGVLSVLLGLGVLSGPPIDEKTSPGLIVALTGAIAGAAVGAAIGACIGFVLPDWRATKGQQDGPAKRNSRHPGRSVSSTGKAWD